MSAILTQKPVRDSSAHAGKHDAGKAYRGRILHIDDEPLFLEAIQEYLQVQGFEVVTAPDGQSGVRLFSHEPFDLVLLDLRMPRMDGMQVFESLSRADPEVPVIIVSGNGLMEDAVRALRLGAADFLVKPVPDLQLMVHAVERALERSRLRQDNRRHRQHLEDEVLRRSRDLRREVDEHRQARQEIQEALREKDLLLQEIHHRVKNNLQIISSLVALSARGSEDGPSRELARDIRSKINSMALIHNQLYRSDNFTGIDLGRYIGQLCRQLSQMYASGRVRTVLRADSVLLDIDKAIPCGLICNELISNAYKYAFPEGEGRLEVQVRDAGHGKVTVRVADDGPGLPDDTEFDATQSLGLRLIRNLVRHQLLGSIEIGSGPGTDFAFHFDTVEPAN